MPRIQAVYFAYDSAEGERDVVYKAHASGSTEADALKNVAIAMAALISSDGEGDVEASEVKEYLEGMGFLVEIRTYTH